MFRPSDYTSKLLSVYPLIFTFIHSGHVYACTHSMTPFDDVHRLLNDIGGRGGTVTHTRNIYMPVFVYACMHICKYILLYVYNIRFNETYTIRGRVIGGSGGKITSGPHRSGGGADGERGGRKRSRSRSRSPRRGDGGGGDGERLGGGRSEIPAKERDRDRDRKNKKSKKEEKKSKKEKKEKKSKKNKKSKREKKSKKDKVKDLDLRGVEKPRSLDDFAARMAWLRTMAQVCIYMRMRMCMFVCVCMYFVTLYITYNMYVIHTCNMKYIRNMKCICKM